MSGERSRDGVLASPADSRPAFAVAAVVTALAFVAKHLVVDMAAPLYRVTALVVLAFLLCGLRARYGTTSSTVAHLAVNVVSTAPLLMR